VKTIFIEDNRLRGILADRNEEMRLMLLTKKLRGPLRIKLTTKEVEGKTCFGWEVTDLEYGPSIEERLGETTELLKPVGSFWPLKDIFNPVENIGVFKKPKLERK